MKGYRTVLFGLVVALLPAALTYLGGVDWTVLGISPAIGMGIGSAIISLRSITTTRIAAK
jgi:hypothetical protein